MFLLLLVILVDSQSSNFPNTPNLASKLEATTHSAMADTLLRHLSTAETFLLSSTKFWSSLSTVAVSGAFSSFYSTHHSITAFHNSGKYIIFAAIGLHFLLFFSNPNTLKNTFAPFFHGSAKKWILRITAMRAAYLLHYVPDQSVTGLIFVICVWIDVIAIARIIRPSIDLWIGNSVFMAIVSRSNVLYGFTSRYWMVMLICFPFIFVQIRLDGYDNEESKEKEG